MSSTYTPPDVIVSQIRRTVAADVTPPLLPVVVIGPSRAIAVRETVGTYESGSEYTGDIPNLPEGGLVDIDTVSVYLNSTLTLSGTKLGLFPVPSGSFSLASDNTELVVADNLALEYSLLNNTDNNLTANTVRATGDASATLFTDASVSFSSLSATAGESYVVIDSPDNQAGRYVIDKWVQSGDDVHSVRLNKVDGDNVAELSDSFVIGSTVPTGTVIIGKPTDSETSGTNNVSTVSGTAVASSLGVGVVGDALAVVTGSDANTVVTSAITIPDSDSGDAVAFAPDSVGRVNAAWVALVDSVVVGDWFRIAITSGAVRDFKITAINTTTKAITLQNPDFSGTGTTTLTGGGGTVDSFTALRVYKGKNDIANGAGDVLNVISAGVEYNLEIASARPTFINLLSTVPVLVNGNVVTLKRGPAFRNAVATYDLVKRVTSGFTGTLEISYQADRVDLALNGVMEITDQKDVEAQLGVIHSANKLALLANEVVLSGTVASGRSFYALSVSSDTLEGYEEALATLESSDVYFLVPATQDLTILEAFKTHVNAQSLPENKHERRVIGSTELTTFARQCPTLATDALTQGAKTDDREFVAGTADLSSVTSGSLLVLMSGSDQETATELTSYIIASVSLPHTINTVGEIDEDYTADTYFKVVTQDFNKNRQAEYWRDEAASFNDSRVTIIRPDICEVTYTDKTGLSIRNSTEILPTYYAAAAVAGLKSYLPAQQPITNVPLAGIGRLYHSNTYFNPIQLNTIAGGGNFILVQTTPNSIPYSRHQLTTNMTDIISRELSIGCCVDFAAKYFRSSLQPYIGNRNITNETLTQLRGVCEAVARSLVGSGTLISCEIEKMFQNPDQLDSVVVEVGVGVPFPCNKIYVKLYI